MERFGRRDLLKGSAAMALGTAFARAGSHATSPGFQRILKNDAIRGQNQLRPPGSLPYPDLAAGTDTMPEIEHVVVLMMENHSYDNYLGMLRRPGADGFTIGSNGLPTATNPYPDGALQHAFEMPSACQLDGKPTQEWQQSHIQYANGTNQGFVISESGPVAMGYWTGATIPFYCSLARTFPLGDRWFCSLLGQTYPNRRYLIAATSAGMVDDVLEELAIPAPNGTIFDRLDAFGISWTDYYTTFPTGATAMLYPAQDAAGLSAGLKGGTTSNPSPAVPEAEVGVADLAGSPYFKPITEFFSDAKRGSLPAFAIIDPNFSTGSEEDPQNITIGEQFSYAVVNALMESPAWEKTLLVWTYDEHGGYFDHVPPPPAIAPDDIPPLVLPAGSEAATVLGGAGLSSETSDLTGIDDPAYDGFRRYGFRVPAVVVSPFSKRNHVSHLVYDHTSILATLERKWNLPALTWRDANANDLMDFLDLQHRHNPPFAEPPIDTLAKPDPASCTPGDAGTIPPPGSVSG